MTLKLKYTITENVTRKYKWDFFFQMCDMQFYALTTHEKFLSALQSRTSSQKSKAQAPKI